MQAKYRSALPQLGDQTFMTDGGMETTLIFHDAVDLPHFAAFDLLRRPGGRGKTKDYYRPYLELARENGVGFILETSTWRASADWASLLGYSSDELADANRDAVALLVELRDEYETAARPIVISGCLGPRGDGYNPTNLMSADEAERYHSEQIATLAEAGVDLITAMTLNYPGEAIGIVRAAKRLGVPVVISFTAETDGRLPTGHTLSDAINQVDAETAQGPAYYMINCAHPTHLEEEIAKCGGWTDRIHGLRANASKRSHAELDEATDLDAGDPVDLSAGYDRLSSAIPRLNILGGCCGTDHRHIRAIFEARAIAG